VRARRRAAAAPPLAEGARSPPARRSLAAPPRQPLLLSPRPAATPAGQDYARDRAPEIGAAEHQRRRQARDIEEVVAAGKRAGRDAAATARDVAALAALLPGGLNLFKMKAADWLTVSSDVNGAAARLITLKLLYPSADVFKLVAARPRVFLYSEAELRADAAEVHALLAQSASVCAVIEAVPELSDAGALRRALATLRTSYPGQARRMPLAAAIPAAPPHSPSPPPSPRALTLSRIYPRCRRRKDRTRWRCWTPTPGFC